MFVINNYNVSNTFLPHFTASRDTRSRFPENDKNRRHLTYRGKFFMQLYVYINILLRGNIA